MEEERGETAGNKMILFSKTFQITNLQIYCFQSNFQILTTSEQGSNNS